MKKHIQNSKVKISIWGDSISEGIGKRKMNYCQALVEKMSSEVELFNFAKTGTTIDFAYQKFKEIQGEKFDIGIIMYGSVDAQIRPNLERNRYGICRLIPKRYKIGGMLSPRAFYSKKWYRYIPDRVDNIVRFFLNRLVLLTQGSTQWIPIEQFEMCYRKLVTEMMQTGTKKIILVSTVYIDDRFFLNSSCEYRKYNDVIKKIADEIGAKYVDVFSQLQKQVDTEGWNACYSHDHFHPNKCGYDLIATNLVRAIESVER